MIVEEGQLACGTMRENFMVNQCKRRLNLPKSSLARPGLAKMKFIVMYCRLDILKILVLSKSQTQYFTINVINFNINGEVKVRH